MPVTEKLVARLRSLKRFVADVRAELKKVSWPNRAEVYGTTLVVIVTVFFFGFYLFLIDFLLQHTVRRVYDYFQ